ncbi:MAG: hypothetical protein Q8Q09_07535 [Deltaproteobacteria bacterium]|nr:hypothetical protein [Deltaproteobacteria bacterium]
MALHPCSQCGRHVRHAETQCPFCGHALTVMSSHLAPVQFVTRAAMVLGAALTVSACQEPQAPTQNTPTLPTVSTPVTQQMPTQISPTPQPVIAQPTSPLPEPSIAAAYGAPMPPEPTVAPPPPPVGPNHHASHAPRYGIAPMAPIAPVDHGSHVRRYGAPMFMPWDDDHV